MCKVLRLSDLCEKYKDKLKDTPFANPKYRAGKFKKHEVYNGKLSLCKVSAKGKFESFLVYSTGRSLDMAIQSTHKLYSADTISIISTTPIARFAMLQDIFLNCLVDSTSVPWNERPGNTYCTSSEQRHSTRM